MVVFNGDFHWLDVDARDFQAISESALTHRATQGNVEASLVLGHRDCGCAYPDYVDDTTVAHSNAVAARLRHTASQFPDLQKKISLLPHHLTVAVAGERVGIVHGDPTSLAGWRLALEAMEPPDPVVRPTSFSGPPTDGSVVADWLRRANVSVLCCTHTGLPFAQDFTVEGHRYLVINNGSVGLPCFSEPCCGVMTRLSGQPDPPPDSLYGTRIGRLR